MKPRFLVTGPDGDLGYVTDVTLIDRYSFEVWYDDEGNICAKENGERVEDVRAVELYGLFGGVVGWRIMDAVDPR